MKTNPFLCLLGLLLLGACSSIERGVVTARGHRVDEIVSPPVDYYWVDVRGKDRAGEEKTERIQLFKKDWDRFKKGDPISPHDFDMIGATKAIGASLQKLAGVEKKAAAAKPAPPEATPSKRPEMKPAKKASTPAPRKKSSPSATPAPKAAKPAPATKPVAPAPTPAPKPKPENEPARFHIVEARAHDDPAVREMKRRVHSARSDEEQVTAFKEYRRALWQKMRELDPTLKDRIDAAEAR